MKAAFDQLMAGDAPILMDGALGTELHRRGVNTALPLWSAGALLSNAETVLAIHRDYVAAGGGP